MQGSSSLKVRARFSLYFFPPLIDVFCSATLVPSSAHARGLQPARNAGTLVSNFKSPRIIFSFWMTCVQVLFFFFFHSALQLILTLFHLAAVGQ